ncbi:MAG: glycosyltransferase family 39 protein, partial [Patescibacteria group bacterium]
MRKLTPKYGYLLILVGLFFAQFLFISPVGEFALNDDWVHTEIARHWADTGEFRMIPFAGPTFYLPIIYGAALIKLFGFSFTILRLSTLAFSLATIIVFYFFLNKISDRPKLAFLGTLALWLNPIFYNLSFTFMTDIPALFFIIVSVYLYYTGFENKNKLWLFGAGLLAVAGFFIRQTNILVLGAAGILALTQTKNIPFKSILWIFGVPLLAWAGIYYFLFSRDLLPLAGADHLIFDPTKLLKHSIWWLWYAVPYLGLATAPLFAGWAAKNIDELKKPKYSITIFFALVSTIIIYFSTKQYFPYIPNIVNTTGLGPMNSILNGETSLLFSKKIWLALSLIFATGGAWTIINFFTAIKPESQTETQSNDKILFSFCSILAVIFLLPILFLESFDRYFLPIFSFVLIIL